MVRSLHGTFALTMALVLASSPALAGRVGGRPPRKSAAAPLPRNPAPRGMLELPSGGTGRILTSRMSGSASARKMLMALRLGIDGYFDARPILTAAFADGADQNLQAAFTARLKGVPVRGVIAIQMQGDTGQATLLFDRAVSFRQTFARLLQAANGSAGPRGRGGPAPVRLTTHQLLDGSGQIDLPPGWRVTGSYKGTVDAAGPNGEVLGLGSPAAVVSPQAAPLFPSSPAVDFSDPVRAALDYAAFQARQAQSQGLPETRITRVHDTRPTTLANHRAAFIRFSTLLYGKPYEGLGLYAIMPVDQTQGILYMSYVLAPPAVFKKSLPGMWAAWMSWGVKGSVLRERMLSAVQSMRETGDILTSTHQYRQESAARVNKAWSQYIRDEGTWSDPSSGRRYVIPNAALPPDGNMGPLQPVPLSGL